MPGEEETVQVDVLGLIDVDDGVIEIFVDGGRVLAVVQLRRLRHDTFDGIGVCLAFLRLHEIKILAHAHVLRSADGILAWAVLFNP